ncbi:CAP domain-containing protein [Kineosporia babensis]|uniref:CAP domain-containing protein n=1 Tax=Kineosporia babensis TaxID=499548 RepID=A0A9X1SUY6_9ACTN|nr:CAP domain-containing protein [Kineosporia babensis]MCD5313437.1 CAP domain-containing protein [Kineosporia babensis]
MHSQSTNWTRNAILVLAPLTLIALVAVFLGPKLFGGSSSDETKLASANFNTEAPTPEATTAPATTPEPEATLAVAAQTPKDLGTVKGTYTVKGPKKVSAGSLVVFVVDGKKRQVVKDEKAPYALKLNTKKLPNGKYTVSVLTSRAGKSATVSTSTFTVKNTKKKPAAEPTSSASPTTGKPEPAPSTPDDKPSTTTAPSTGGSAAQQVLKLTNQERASNGCKTALKLDSKLNAAAQGHSDDMAAKKYFSHDSQDGRSPFDRMADAGYKFGAAAENIAQGYGSAEAVVEGWMNSAGHKANILNCDYTEMGLGLAKNGNYWTQVFAKPA